MGDSPCQVASCSLTVRRGSKTRGHGPSTASLFSSINPARRISVEAMKVVAFHKVCRGRREIERLIAEKTAEGLDPEVLRGIADAAQSRAALRRLRRLFGKVPQF